jgi:O-antigen/teichoic acid export membrane protein
MAGIVLATATQVRFGSSQRIAKIWPASRWLQDCRLLARNFGNLMIGHQIGSSALGIYILSDRLMRLLLTGVTEVTGAVMFPALSMLQNNLESMKRAYLRATRIIALVTFPMVLGLSVLAEPVILVVYGDQWRNAAGMVQLLCFAGLVQSVYNTAGWIFLSHE